MPEIRMPDFENRLANALTQRLRRERRASRLMKLGGAAACAAVAASVAFSVSNGGDLAPSSAKAQPYPKIIYRDAVAKTPTDDEIGVSGAQKERARPFRVEDYTGYVVPNAAGDWCISVPDLATGNPGVERGTACAASVAELERFGLSVRVGTVVAAAVPAGAPDPVRVHNGSSRRVPVDGAGVAIVTDLRPGERFSVRSVDGETRSYTGLSTDLTEPTGFLCGSDGKITKRPRRDCR